MEESSTCNIYASGGEPAFSDVVVGRLLLHLVLIFPSSASCVLQVHLGREGARVLHEEDAEEEGQGSCLNGCCASGNEVLFHAMPVYYLVLLFWDLLS